MRIDRLDLERYGHFDGTSLDLSDPAARLHIVHGPNEAGKSTSLSAIIDLLFGVPDRSRLGYRHGNNALRIGARLVGPDGSVLEVKRRKGRTNTLLDVDGGNLPDNRLSPWLGGIDRAGFERLFGLDHDRLLAGGRAMLEAGGDLARTLFQAGSGLSGLNDIITSLSREADEIGSPHRKQATKPLWEAIEANAAAEKRKKVEAVHADAWDAALAAVDHARTALAGIHAQLAAAERARSAVERRRRVRPLLARLDDLAASLADAGTGPDLPPALADQWRQARAALMDADNALDRALAERDQSAQTLADAGPEPTLLRLTADIEALFQRAGEIAKDRIDLPKRQQDQQATATRLADLAARIGRDGQVAALVKDQPAPLLITRIRTRMQALALNDTALAGVKKREGQALAALRQVDHDQPDDLPAGMDLEAADRALAAAKRMGEVERVLAKHQLAVTQAMERTDRLLSRLPRWKGTANILAALPLPLTEQVEALRDRFNDLDRRRQRWSEAQADAEGEQRRLTQELRQLAEGGEVPTPAAIAQARRQRDGLWAGLRASLLTRQALPDPETIPAFDGALHSADQLADQREREAQRVARFMRADSDLAAISDRLAALSREDLALAKEAGDLETAWQTLWRPCGINPARPPDMLSWLRQAAEIVAALEQQEQAAAVFAAASADADLCAGHLRQALVLIGAAISDGTDLAGLRARAEAAVQRAATQVDAAARVARDRQRLTQSLDDIQAERTELDQERHDLRRGWDEFMAEFGLGEGADPAEAEQALSIWADIAADLKHQADISHRIDTLERDIAAHGAQVRDLRARAMACDPGLLLPTDIEQLPAALFKALSDARDRASQRGLLTRRVADADAALTRAHSAQRQAQDHLDALYRLHGLGPDDDVAALVATSARRREGSAQVKTVTDDLAKAGDGVPLTQLRADIADSDPDALAADAAASIAEIARLQAELPDASARLRDAERALDDLRHRAGIGAAAQDAAAADGHAAKLAGRWLRLRAASLLLTQAVERYRDRNEHPLLRRAGSILAAMAASGGNPVVRLKVDYAEADHPVLVGVRRDGADVAVEGMSEGLRDQLFLSLRIASVEAHVAQSTPLPFIADDLFITSDEDRTRAGLLALGELGMATQVILFTHHRHVADLAVDAMADRVRIHRLSTSG